MCGGWWWSIQCKPGTLTQNLFLCPVHCWIWILQWCSWSLSPGLDNWIKQFVPVSQSGRLTEVDDCCRTACLLENLQMHIPSHLYFHHSSSNRSAVCMEQFSVFFSAVTHTGSLSLVWVKSRETSLRPADIPPRTHPCLFQPSVNNRSVNIHHSQHSSGSQNPSISLHLCSVPPLSFYYPIFLSFFCWILLTQSTVCQPTIIFVLGHIHGKFEECVVLQFVYEVYQTTSPILMPTLSEMYSLILQISFLVSFLKEMYVMPGLYSVLFPVKETLRWSRKDCGFVSVIIQ